MTRFRPDIEGLRAVAIGVVLLCHAGLPFAGGGYVGVDVFFVISGFLITRMLVAELEDSGRISLVRFYVRRAKRLLPLAVTVLACVVALATLLFSPVRADVVSGDVVSAGTYTVNWHLSAQAVDYFGSHDEASPIQHFWSLAVEEQFYLVWPALLIGLTALLRRRARDVRRPLAVLAGGLGAISLVYAIQLAADTPAKAYFSTYARAWELAAGVLLALVLAGRRPPRALAVPAAWTGIAAIGMATVLFDSETAMPSLPALLPVLGAVALMVGGAGHARPGPVRLLELRPMQFVGRISYSLYLWHWPLLVFAGAIWGTLSPLAGIAVVLASAVPTVISHRLIERPLRQWKIGASLPRRAIALGPACAGAAVALGLLLSAVQPSVPVLSADEAAGATALASHRTIQRSADALRPEPRAAGRDRSRAYSDGCLVLEKGTKSPSCAYGARHPRRTVVLFGDSHAMQYFPALEALALHRRWRLVVLTKAGCPPATVGVVNAVLRRDYRECGAWRERTLRRIERVEKPALVVASGRSWYTVVQDGRRLGTSASKRALAAGYAAALRRLRATGAKVAVIRDTPHTPRDEPSCVADSLHHLRRCAFAQGPALDKPNAAAAAAAAAPGVRAIDPTPRLCIRRVCPAVIGDVLVYRNGGHLTATYARTMAGWIGHRLPRV